MSRGMARPIKFGGTTLRPDSEFDYYIDRQVVEGTWKQPHDASNCDAVKRLWHAVQGTPLEPAMKETIEGLGRPAVPRVRLPLWQIKVPAGTVLSELPLGLVEA